MGNISSLNYNRKIAKEYKINEGTISNIRQGKEWKHVYNDFISKNGFPKCIDGRTGKMRVIYGKEK